MTVNITDLTASSAFTDDDLAVVVTDVSGTPTTKKITGANLAAGAAFTAVYAALDEGVRVFADATARDAAITSPAEGMVAFLTGTNVLTLYTGSAWTTVGPLHGAGTSWTPAVTQSASVTVTVTQATYFRTGRKITGWFYLTVTGSGTASNDITVSLPVTAASTTMLAGFGMVYDSSASAEYSGFLRPTSTTAVKLKNLASTTAGAYLGSSGMTAGLATGDVVFGQFTYEAAAD